ncbi:MAG TPA: hypothetical protein VF077_00545 [Nitrospiraceae bacterium]
MIDWNLFVQANTPLDSMTVGEESVLTQDEVDTFNILVLEVLERKTKIRAIVDAACLRYVDGRKRPR